MKKSLVLIFLTSAVLCSLAIGHCLLASSPNTISYQGRLRESGQPVSGTRSIQFKLFDASSAGTPVFDSDPQSIYVSSGIFGYQLGSNKAAGYPNFKDLEWATSSYWLEISVGGNAMSPRERINAMPYAFMSSTAASLNGAGNIQITGAGPHYIVNGSIGVGTTNPATKFEVKDGVVLIQEDYAGGTGALILRNYSDATNAASVINFQTGPAPNEVSRIYGGEEGADNTGYLAFWTKPDGSISERMRIDKNGNVGIGTTSPTANLYVVGTSTLTANMKVGGRIEDKTGYVSFPGEIRMYGGSAAPAGWLMCDGSAKDRTTYADLFAAIGTTFGTGDGSTTFNLPDFRGVFPKGAGTTNRVSVSTYAAGGYYSGGILGTYSFDKQQGHTHSVVLFNDTPTSGNAGYASGAGTGPHGAGANPLYVQGIVSDGINGPPRTGKSTEPQNLSVNYIIKY